MKQLISQKEQDHYHSLIKDYLPFCWDDRLGIDDTGKKIIMVIRHETRELKEIIRLNQNASRELASQLDSLKNKTKILIDCFITPEEFEEWRKERNEGIILPWKEQALSIIESFEI